MVIAIFRRLLCSLLSSLHRILLTPWCHVPRWEWKDAALHRLVLGVFACRGETQLRTAGSTRLCVLSPVNDHHRNYASCASKQAKSLEATLLHIPCALDPRLLRCEHRPPWLQTTIRIRLRPRMIQMSLLMRY